MTKSIVIKLPDSTEIEHHFEQDTSETTVLFQELETAFSTADADDPVLKYDSGDLRVEFRDWCEKDVVLIFENCANFAWAELGDDFEMSPDRTYAVKGTKWASSDSAKRRSLVHFMLCFNASYSALEVLAGDMRHIGSKV